MSKFFDIKPPQSQFDPPKPKSHQSSTKRPKTNFLAIVIFLLLVILFFSYINATGNNYKVVGVDNTNINNDETNANPVDKIATSSNPAPTESEKAIPTTDASPTPETTASSEATSEPQITVLNGARVDGIASEVKSILEKNNITVSSLGNTQNLYNGSVIYYSEANLKTAQKMQEILADYKPKLEINEQFASGNAITVVIGKKE